MDSIFDEKINNFSAIVLNEAQKKRAELEAQNESEKSNRIDSLQSEFLNDAYNKIQNSIDDIRRYDNERILSAQVNSRRELLMKRESIISNVFNRVKKRICDFMNSDDYDNWLKKKIIVAISEAGEGSKTVYVRLEDHASVDKIIDEKYNGKEDISINVINDTEFIGGIKVENLTRNILIDYSFNELINEYKNDFLKKSGLTIE